VGIVHCHQPSPILPGDAGRWVCVMHLFLLVQKKYLGIPMCKLQDIGDRIREAMELVAEWCADTGFPLAQEKTEIILLTGKRVSKILSIDIGGMGI
jgi:hypothetical protein